MSRSIKKLNGGRVPVKLIPNRVVRLGSANARPKGTHKGSRC